MTNDKKKNEISNKYLSKMDVANNAVKIACSPKKWSIVNINTSSSISAYAMESSINVQPK